MGINKSNIGKNFRDPMTHNCDLGQFFQPFFNYTEHFLYLKNLAKHQERIKHTSRLKII